MKNIITALGNPILNDKLIENKNIKVLVKDIQYQDGIFETLEKNEKIDYLILSEILPGENNIKELISKIIDKNNNIKIILILENKKEELEKILKLKGIYKIYYNNEIEINEIINIIENGEKDNDENIKELLIKNNISLEKEKKNKKIKSVKKEKNIKNKKVISVVGTGGVGKSIITLNLSNVLKNRENKILIIDFDILNNSLHTILGVNKYPQKIKNKLQKNDLINNKINIKELIIKINKKVDLISGINLLFDSKYKISSEKIKCIIDELKEYYDYIIIDTSSECFFDYTKNIINCSDKVLFLLEANLLEIKKSKKLLEMYEENWNIKKEKINMIINKYNENSVDDNIIKNIFSEYKILGKIKLNKKYNVQINKNFKSKQINKNIKKEYEKITNKIIKLKNRKIKLIIENFYNRLKFNFYQKNKI